jgi:cell wall-associated NlpC family hydrolase
LRVRILSAVSCCATFLAVSAASALASGAGGAIAGASPHSGPAPKSPLAPASVLHTAPVTARSSKLSYRGPVYQKTASGAIVPYLAPTSAGRLGDATGGSPVATGGSPVGVTANANANTQPPQLLVPGASARYVNGLAAAPMSAPAAVQAMIWAGNQIVGLPYIYGGGHASFISPGYDCSGTVSFALHGASLLTIPEDSSELMRWGSHGLGRWVTLFSDPGHAYMTVAGLRLDTSAADDPSNQQGPRWRPLRAGNGGFTVRHPLGL